MSTGPLASYAASILPEWIDYNGHMNVAYYVLVFDRGTDGLLDTLGLGAEYRRTTDHTMYALESHVCYLRELQVGNPVQVTTQLVAADAKRLHVFHRMEHATDGFLAATNELMCLHVDLSGPRSVPFPDTARKRIDSLVAAHGRLQQPEQLGRSIRMPARSV
jgi:acyl-CoA thioester hydrolase